jgi:hypothetical protein
MIDEEVGARGEDYHAAIRTTKDRLERMIVGEIRNTSKSYEEIGKGCGLNKTAIAKIATRHGIRRKRGTGSVAHPRHKERT